MPKTDHDAELKAMLPARIIGAALLAGNLLLAGPAHAASEALVYSFQGSGDGAEPLAGLIDVSGTLYGTTYGSFGGQDGYGTVFKITTAGAEKVLYNFGGALGGGNTYAGLTNVDGTLYGTSYGTDPTNCANANSGCGTVFQVNSKGVEKTLYTFKGGNDGNGPMGLLKVGDEFYGTTRLGGAHNFGTVFKVTPAGVDTVLYSFKGPASADGSDPNGDLILAGGLLYGTTYEGGSNYANQGQGTIFKVTKTGRETVLHAFQGTDGGYPVGGLIKVGGNFYGATQYGGVGGFGGASGAGTVFSVTPAGAETVLYAFSGANDGSGPYAGLIAVGGVLYGTTYFGGGAGNQGTVFRLTLAGAETVLYSFKGHDAGDGSYPAAPLIHVGNALYGTNAYGGVNYQGAVFKVTGFKK